MPWWAVLTDATICVPCPAGTAGISGRCSQCPPGSEPNDIRSECVVCIPGTFSVAGERCLTCPVGMGSDYLRAGCLSCPPGSVSTVGICSECDSGSRPIGAPVVEACTVVVGTITEENTAATTCMLTAFVAADPAAKPVCATTDIVVCAGATADQGTCSAAGACTFTAGANGDPDTCVTTVVAECAPAMGSQADCVAAGACTFTDAAVVGVVGGCAVATGSGSCTYVAPVATYGGCEDCPAGKAGIEGICNQCPSGSYVDDHSNSCVACVAGKFKTSNINLACNYTRNTPPPTA